MIGCISDDYFTAYINKEGKFVDIKINGNFKFAVQLSKLYREGLLSLGLSGLCLMCELNRIAAQKQSTVFQFQFNDNGKIHRRLIKVELPDPYWTSMGAIIKGKFYRLIYKNDIAF